MAAGKPDFSVKTVAPPQPDPWLTEAANRGFNGPGTDYSRPGQLGNAWTDSFNSQLPGQFGLGTPQAYSDPNEGNVYRGAINAQGQKIDLPSTTPINTAPLATPVRDAKASTPGTLDSRHFGNAVGPTTAITPSVRINPNPKGVMTTVPWEAPSNAYRDEKDHIRYEAPPNFGKRLARAAGGFLKGPDTGRSWINWAQPALRKAVPVTNLPLGAAGAVQGYRSNKPMTRTWNPNDPQNQELPEGQSRQVPPASQAALNQVLTDPSSAHHTQDSGGYVPNGGDYSNPSYQDPSYNGYQQQPTTQPAPQPAPSPAPAPTTPPVATTPSSSPLPTVPATTPPAARPPTGTPTGNTAQPRPANPENRVNPTTGEPDPAGVLPQHMPGYVPPTQQPAIPNTRDGKLAVDALYRKYYGRDATPEEFQAHTKNPGGINAVEAALKAAPDALPQDAPPATNTPPGSPAETAALQAITGAGSGGGGYSYLGFDFGQDPANRNIQKSAKYAFSYFAGQAAQKGVPQPRSKAEAEAWFTQNIAPGMNAQGFKVHKVVGDKAFISTRENPGGEWIDFQGNSGGQGDQPLTWQSQGPQDINSNPEDLFAVQDFGGGGSSLGNSDPGGVGNVLDSGNSALNSFAKQLINRLLEGQALEDALSEETRRTGISQQSLGAVGF